MNPSVARRFISSRASPRARFDSPLASPRARFELRSHGRLSFLILCALWGCDPSRFDDRHQPRDAEIDPSLEGRNDGGRDTPRDADSSTKSDSGATDSGPARSVDGSAAATADSGAATPPRDAGPGLLPEGGPRACSTPPPAGRPLVFSANAPRIVARVQNPAGVDLQLAHSIRPVGAQLLWTLLTTNTKTPNGYGSLGRSASSGPWAMAAESWPQTVELTVQPGADGAPIPLLPSSFTVTVVNPVGVIARGAEASLYLKRYFGFVATEMYLGQLGAGAFTLASAPIRLFEANPEPPTRAPLFGGAAYERAGTVYALACKLELNMTPFRPCALARVPTAAVATRASYEAFQSTAAGAGAWTRDLDAASDVFENGDDVISLSYNAYLGKWLLIDAARADDGRGNGTVLVRAASTAQGPWTEQTTLKLPDSPEGIPARYALEQPDLAQNCGQRLILSYVEPSLEYTNVLGYPQISHGKIALIAFELQ